MQMKNKKLMVLDGNSIVNRAFYGIRLLTTRDGTFTNAVYGFLSILSKLLDEDRPDALCVCFDVRAPTFRHEKFAAYKAQRKPMPEELRPQIPLLKEVLDAMRIPRYELAGWEADDLIGTISARCAAENWDCEIVTGDRDSLQLVNENVHVKLVVSRMGKTTTTEYDVAKFSEEYGFAPAKIVDLKSLWGDTSDNIPGVPGIGEKTGLELVRKFGGIEEIYANLNALDLRDSVKKKLLAGRESAFVSHDLATIRQDAPVDFSPGKNFLAEPDKPALYAIFKRLEFAKLIAKYGLLPTAETCANAGAENSDLPLFAPADAPAKTFSPSPDAREEILAKCAAAEHVFADAAPESLSAHFAFALPGEPPVNVVAADFEPGKFAEFLGKFFGNAEIKKIAHDVKPLWRELLRLGIAPAGFVFDTALGAYLLDPSRGKYPLDELAPLPESGATPAQKIVALAQLFSEQTEELERTGMRKLFDEIELPLCGVLAEMEFAGMCVDREKLVEFSAEMSAQSATAQAEIFALAGTEFNIQSPKQLGEILFEKLGLPAGKKNKKGYSTNAEVLKKLENAHPIVAKIGEFRERAKLKTIVDGLVDAIDENGRIHTTFNMTATATGRLSSSEPNLQNIPTRGELGNAIRKMFVAPAGTVLADADYSQIELRLLAHISEDEAMREAFRAGEDIHSVTACRVFGVEPVQVTPTMRRFAKAVNFGIVYGIGDFSLAQDIGVSRRDAHEYIEKYLAKYSGVRDYMKNVVERAKADGFVSTVFGRRRYLPELKSSNHNLRAFGERVALNAPIQGTAADLMKLAMIRVAARLKRENLGARMVLQIHDELVLETPLAEETAVKKILSEEMENVAQLSVPLRADATAGATWGDAK